MSRYTPPGTATDPDAPSVFEIRRRRRLRVVAVVVCISFVLPLVATIIAAAP